MNAIKTILGFVSTVAVLASCGTFKPSANLTSSYTSNNNNNGVRFLDVKAAQHDKVVISQKSTLLADAAPTTEKVVKPKGGNVDYSKYSAIQIKYAEKMGVEPGTIKNVKLFESIDAWYGTRYVFGGMSKRGVDCSSLMQHLYTEGFGLTIPRTAITQYRASARITQEDLQEGDLIFFHTTRSGISHVGLYIGNRKFVHASSSKGVTISSLDESYYAPRYRGAGRFNKDYKNDGKEDGKDEEMEGTK